SARDFAFHRRNHGSRANISAPRLIYWCSISRTGTPHETKAAIIAPVLVPATKSNTSARTRLGLFNSLRNSSSIRARICSEKMPRIPPPSKVSIRFIPSLMRSAGEAQVGMPLDHFLQQPVLGFHYHAEERRPRLDLFKALHGVLALVGHLIVTNEASRIFLRNDQGQRG